MYTINTMKSESIASVCCLVGLPGCGKSTFARSIRDLLATESYFSQFNDIVIIEYDAIMKNELLTNSELLSEELIAWRQSRMTALEILNNTLIKKFTGGDGNTSSSSLIIMDDNFHLRSMRRDVYRSCQEIVKIFPHAIVGFSILYFNTPLEQCLERNDSRSGTDRIPNDVIHRMATILEPPNDKKANASFEQFHVSINNSDELFSTDTKERNDVLKLMNECITNSIQSPIRPKIELSEEEIAQVEQQRMHDREETINCKIQRIDQLLRKLVSAVCRIDKTRYRDTSVVRNSILEMVRQQRNEGMDIMGHDNIVQNFSCILLGIESTSDWQNLNVLTIAINDAYKEFKIEDVEVLG
jgi:tRNA uridine 5-carbamoylmethylation protein Kti12